MLPTMQWMLHKLTRSRGAPAQAKVIAKLAGMRRRHPWAQAVQQLVGSASRSASAARIPRPDWEAPLLLSTKVVKAARPELLAVKEALLDTRRPISAAAVQQLKTFLSDPTASPLFGRDPIIARRAATQLQRSVAAHPNPDPGHPVSPNTNMGARR
jgi:hypothetical protein